MTGYAAPSDAAWARRDRRRRRLVIVLVAVIALVLIVDRVSLLVADRVAASTIKRSEHLGSSPRVAIAGFPFLTQLVSGHYPKVTITAKNVPLSNDTSTTLTLSSLTVVLHSVHVSRSFTTVDADRGSASGKLSYAELSHALGMTVQYAGTVGGVGAVKASVNRTILGQSVNGVVVAGVRLDGAALSFVDPRVTAQTVNGQSVSTGLRGAFGAPIPLGSLPFDARVTAINASSSGLQLSLSGTDLHYQR